MAEKKPTTVVKINLPGGTVTAGPPLGSSLGPTGVNLGAFVKQRTPQKNSSSRSFSL